MTPLSYQGFGFTAILVMVAILSIGQLLKYLKARLIDSRKENEVKRVNS